MSLSEPVQQKVKAQVEFYFSDSNLPRDKFLRGKTEEDPEGFVDIALLCSFTRMCKALGFIKILKPEEVEDDVVAQVAEILRTSDNLTVSEDGKRVRRTVPLGSCEEVNAQAEERTLYVSPFPFDVTLEPLLVFFRTVAPVNCVRLRRHTYSKDFRGSVLVEFASLEDAEKAKGQALVYEGAPLKMEFWNTFKAKIKEDRQAKAATVDPATPSGTENAKPAGESDEAIEGGTPEAAEHKTEGGAAAADEAQGGEEEEEEAAVPDWEPCCVVRFTFEDGLPDDLKYFDLKKSFGGRDAGVAYVEHPAGELSGCIRFRTREDAAGAISKGDPPGTAAVKEKKVRLEILEGPEEIAYYKRADAAKKAAAAKEEAGGGHSRGVGPGSGAWPRQRWPVCGQQEALQQLGFRSRS
eukprot:jgi/Botrbrau1/8707/Bobra.0311s0019.1